MKTLFYYFNTIKSLNLLWLLSVIMIITVSCGDDDEPGMDPDAPTISATEGLTVRGGETVSFTFSVVAAGTISEVSVTATEGTATITNENELIGTTNGLASIDYVTTEAMSGTQTVTLTVTDEQGNNISEPTEVEVFAPISFGIALVSGAGDVTTTFLQGLIDLDVTTINNSNSTELPRYASVFTDGEFMFTPGFGAPATMGRYSFNSLGEAEPDQEIIVPGSNTFSTVEILNKTEAFATVGGGISRIVKFDPSTMRISSEIDLSDAGEGVFYADMIIRGNNLFVALNDFGGSGVVSVGVVDLTTNTLTKIITDDRSTTPLGSTNTAVFAMDDNDDIYVHGSGLFSEFSEDGKKPSGILRIKSDETEFDTDYFFNLTEATGFTSCYGLYHFGDGLTFTTISEDDANFFGPDGADPVFRYYRINLETQTSLGDLDASLPNSFAASRTMFLEQFTDDEILFPVAGSDEDALYSYDIATGNVSKKITSESGFVSGLVRIN